MIWQMLSGIIAGMAVRKELPETKELFETKVIETAMGVLDYTKEDIMEVLYTTNCTQFAEVLCQIYQNKKAL